MTRQQKEAVWLAGLLLVAVAIWYYYRLQRTVPSGKTFVAGKYVPMSVESSRIDWDRLLTTRKTEYKSTGRDITSAIAPPSPEDIKKQQDAQKRQLEQQQEAAKFQTPPPVMLPVKFFGYGTVPNGTARRAFFTDGEDVYIAAEGDTLQGRFRILRIGNTSVEFEEIASGKRGSAQLEEQGPSA